ncbi:hypothetical protein Csa_001165 [Cucumis sativus]|nr:hypothetical protein Csa_001165 [Cucumis sativus]
MKMQVIKSSSIRKRPLYFETMTCKGMLKFLSGDQTAGGLCLLHAKVEFVYGLLLSLEMMLP